MLIKIDGIEIAAYPKGFMVTPLDVDDSETSVRTSDATLNRDRIAVKRQIEMEFGLLTWAETSQILQAVSGVFVDVYYPDPQEGIYVTKTFYVGNRPTPAAVESNGVLYWSGLRFTLTER